MVGRETPHESNGREDGEKSVKSTLKYYRCKRNDTDLKHEKYYCT